MHLRVSCSFLIFFSIKLSMAQYAEIQLKNQSNTKTKTLQIGDYVEVKILGKDQKIKGTLASAGLLKGRIKNISENGLTLQLDSTSLSSKEMDSNEFYVESNTIEFIKAKSKSRNTTKLLLMAIPSAGVITLLFVPYGIMPIVVLSPVWAPTIFVGAKINRYKKYPIQEKKWVLALK